MYFGLQEKGKDRKYDSVKMYFFRPLIARNPGEAPAQRDGEKQRKNLYNGLTLQEVRPPATLRLPELSGRA
jgi:hypothetical protein